MVSLKAKLKACVGKYRTTLARLPRQKEANPCSAVTRVKQLTMPAAHPGRCSLQGWSSLAPKPTRVVSASGVLCSLAENQIWQES